MKLYADRPVRLLRQLLGDVLLVVLIGLCVKLGRSVRDHVEALAGPGQDAEAAGLRFQHSMHDAAGNLSDVPLVGDGVSAPFRGAAASGRDLAAAAHSYQESVADLAQVLRARGRPDPRPAAAGPVGAPPGHLGGRGNCGGTAVPGRARRSRPAGPAGARRAGRCPSCTGCRRTSRPPGGPARPPRSTTWPPSSSMTWACACHARDEVPASAAWQHAELQARQRFTIDDSGGTVLRTRARTGPTIVLVLTVATALLAVPIAAAADETRFPDTRGDTRSPADIVGVTLESRRPGGGPGASS